MQVEAASSLQDTMHFEKAGHHHRKIGQHIVFTQDAAKGRQHLASGAARAKLDQFARFT